MLKKYFSKNHQKHKNDAKNVIICVNYVSRTQKKLVDI